MYIPQNWWQLLNQRQVVESFTKTPSHGDRSLFAMGLGNIVSGEP
jgi:MFS superfamily sulfate permease-like transporter